MVNPMRASAPLAGVFLAASGIIRMNPSGPATGRAPSCGFPADSVDEDLENRPRRAPRGCPRGGEISTAARIIPRKSSAASGTSTPRNSRTSMPSARHSSTRRCTTSRRLESSSLRASNRRSSSMDQRRQVAADPRRTRSPRARSARGASTGDGSADRAADKRVGERVEAVEDRRRSRDLPSSRSSGRSCPCRRARRPRRRRSGPGGRGARRRHARRRRGSRRCFDAVFARAISVLTGQYQYPGAGSYSSPVRSAAVPSSAAPAPPPSSPSGTGTTGASLRRTSSPESGRRCRASRSTGTCTC